MRHPIWCLAALFAAGGAQGAQFTYHGELFDRDTPAEGAYDLRVRSFAQPGDTIALGHATELPAVPIRAGAFSVELDLPEDGDGTTWVEVAVRPAGSNEPYVVLGTPQPVTKVNSTCPGAWALDGNSGAPAGSYLGFADAVPVEFRTANESVARFKSFAPVVAQSPSILIGSSTNIADAVGAMVLGGSGNLSTGRNGGVLAGFANRAYGENAVTLGGFGNRASGFSAVTLGGLSCAGGDASFAGGTRAVVRHGNELTDQACLAGTAPDANGDEGSFVWADQDSNEFITTGPNQFLVRADGGVMFNTNARPFNGDDLVIAARRSTGDADVDITLVTRDNKVGRLFVANSDGRLQVTMLNPTGADYVNFANGARLTAGGVFTNASSRTLKHAFAAIDPADMLARVLQLPIASWEYRAAPVEGRHVGPVAEDFRALFGFGSDARSIATGDADGVALAAIQGLNAKLETENAALRATLDAVMQRLDAIEAAQ